MAKGYDPLSSALELGDALSGDPEVVVKATAPEGAAPEQGTKAYDAYIAELRQKRKPFGYSVQKLALAERPGYKRHWFNDVGGRVQDHLDSGWSHVIDAKGKPVKRTVGTGRDSHALTAYALEVPKVFWDEAQEAQFALAKAKMDDLKKAPIRAPQGSTQASDAGKFYSPKEEAIKETTSLSRS